MIELEVRITKEETKVVDGIGPKRVRWKSSIYLYEKEGDVKSWSEAIKKSNLKFACATIYPGSDGWYQSRPKALRAAQDLVDLLRGLR